MEVSITYDRLICIGSGTEGNKVSTSPGASLEGDALRQAGDAGTEKKAETGANEHRIAFGTYERCKNKFKPFVKY